MPSLDLNRKIYITGLLRNDQNEMVPFGSFANFSWGAGAEIVKRYMGYGALQSTSRCRSGSSSRPSDEKM